MKIGFRDSRPGGKAMTGQQALDAIAALEGIHGRFGKDRAERILGIARQYGIKAEALKTGILRVRPASGGYTLDIDQ